MRLSIAEYRQVRYAVFASDASLGIDIATLCTGLRMLGCSRRLKLQLPTPSRPEESRYSHRPAHTVLVAAATPDV